MNLHIIKEDHNLLFNRKEVLAVIKSEITPSIKDTEETLSKKFSVNADAIRIKHIKGKFGTKDFAVDANIYNSKEDKDKVEPKPKEKKK